MHFVKVSYPSEHKPNPKHKPEAEPKPKPKPKPKEEPKTIPYTLIQKIDDYYVLASLQLYVNSLNNNPKAKPRYSKRYQEVFERGCWYIDQSLSKPVRKKFEDVLNIKANTSIRDVVTLFFTKKEVYGKRYLPIPKIIKNTIVSFSKYSQKGGNTFGCMNEDLRRKILTYELNVHETQKKLVVKVAKEKTMSLAYGIEAEIYKSLHKHCDLKKCGDVVEFIGNGTVDGGKIKINNTDITPQPPWAEVLNGKNYLVLENTVDYVDFSAFIKSNKKHSLCIQVFNKIMRVIKEKNTSYGFFHGDLHSSNVKVRVGECSSSVCISVKLFDFDYSAIIPNGSKNNIISPNILKYNLTDNKNQKIFIEMDDKSIALNKGEFFNDIKKYMYVFDYFRLLLSTIGQLSKIPEFEQNEHKDLIDKEDLDIYNVITQWYTNQLILTKTNTKGCLSTDNWNNCFKHKYFTENIFNKYVTPNSTSSNTANTHTFGSTEFGSTEKEDLPMSLNTQLTRVRALPISENDESSNFSSVEN
jgi:hypothetical protein